MTWKLAPDDTVAVIGAGTMGAGIAYVAAAAGHPVLLFDAAPGAAASALAALGARSDRSVEKGRLTAVEAAELQGRIVDVDTPQAFSRARLVVEAIVEDLTIKRTVLESVAKVISHDSVIATNTSSLSVTAIAAGITGPERVVGMHFFNPAPVMPLVEVVLGAQTDPDVADGVFAAAQAWGKHPVRCASTPGFIVNRVARPFYGESLRLLEEGVADAMTIDAVATGAGGFRMGPFTLMDLVGLDVNLAVSASVYEQTSHDPRFAPNVLQRAMVDAGRLGRKTGAGWFEYDEEPGEAAAPVVAPGPAPTRIEAHGDLGWARGLLALLEASDVIVDVVPKDGPGWLTFDGIHLVPTVGLTAADHAASASIGTSDVAVFDLVHDWSTATRVAIATAVEAGPNVAPRVAGLFDAVELVVSEVADSPALIVMRIVSQLASVAADAVHLGVASRPDVDIAMRLGTNYPEGPLEWADALGVGQVVEVLDHLRSAYGEERYRASIALRRAATAKTTLGSIRSSNAT